jgi:membrane-bound lytic murein transglycosylase B
MQIIRIIPSKFIFFLFGLLVLQLFSPDSTTALEESNGKYFESLQKSLIADGFDENTITELYNSPLVFFETKGVSRLLVHREDKLNYDQYATKESIEKALKYLEKHRIDLERTEMAYNVSKEIIAAIILVESQFGTATDGPSILNTLSTIATLADPEVRNVFWNNVSHSTQLSRRKFEKWAGRKSKWAYHELKSFLHYTAREGMDPLRINGSFAGAMGIAQFMPSSILAYAKDGDSDGRIDLFTHADSIASIANYLNHYGWHMGIERKKAYKIIHRYNHSDHYVEIIFKIFELLKG